MSPGNLAPSIVAMILVGSCGVDSASTEQAPTSTPPSAAVEVATTSPTTVLSTTTALAAEPVPGNDWTRHSPVDAGFDPVRLQAAIDFAELHGSSCLMIVRDGAVVVEEYWNDTTVETDHEIFSTTKSVTAAIVGAAASEGLLDIDDSASDYINLWQGTESETVTIRQLLQNTSGRFYDPGPDLFELGGKPDMTAHAVGLDQQLPPDTEWSYNQSAIQTLDEVIEQATGADTEDYANQALFQRVGMDVEFRRDEAGNVPLFAGLQAGCDDLARFGLLSLRLGQWGSEEIISRDFMAEATSGRTELNRAYGYLYWVNAEDSWDHTDPRRDRSQPFWPDLPLDAFGALGLGNQVTLMLPSHDVVIVRIGPPAATQDYDGVLANDLTARVVSAIDG